MHSEDLNRELGEFHNRPETQVDARLPAERRHFEMRQLSQAAGLSPPSSPLPKSGPRLVDLTPEQRAALTQEQLDELMAAAIPSLAGVSSRVTLADLKRHEDLFKRPLKKGGPPTHEAMLLLEKMWEEET